MGKIIIAFIFVAFSSLTSGKVGQDSLKIKINEVAKYKTDRQIDSVYRVIDIKPVVDAMSNNFGTLRKHMDSLNAVILVSQIALAKQSDTIIEMQKISLENDILRNQNDIKDRQIHIISQGTHIFMALTTLIMVIYFGIGIKNYIYRRDKYNG